MGRVYVTLTIEASFWEEDSDEPLTQAEVEDLAHTSSNWEDWNLLAVSEIRRDS